jgi:hypothetical protein
MASVVLLAACAGVVEDRVVPETPEGRPVVATLHLRDRELTISSTGSGVRYDVKDGSGKLVQSQLTLDELAVIAPELAEVVRSAAVRADLTPGQYLDASRTALPAHAATRSRP